MFTIEKKLDGWLACDGKLATPHGVMKTPALTVVGTKETVK